MTHNDRSYTPALRRSAPEGFKAYSNFSAAVMSNEAGELDAKTRELIAIGVALTTQCEMCLESHVLAAEKAGATQEEIAETVFVAGALRAGGAVTHGMKAMRMMAETGNSDTQ